MESFRDPIHGFIEVSDNEKRIIDSAPFQRLRNIKQLALTNYVYHGAEHTRFGHSIGVMHLASRAFRSAVSKRRFKFKDGMRENEDHIKWLEQILRLIALTHDLGHAPFSHAAEKDLFPCKRNGEPYTHEDYTGLIVMSDPIAGIIRDIGHEYKSINKAHDITPEIICDIYINNKPGDNGEFTLLKTFMDSELDCDKMDYLLRDSLYCGVAYGNFDLDRLIESLVIAERYASDEECVTGKTSPRLCIDSGCINVFEAFVLARYFMFTQVYFHRTRRFFDFMLTKALRKCLPGGKFPMDLLEYLKWDDISVMEILKEKADEWEEAGCIVKRKRWKRIFKTKTHPQSEGLAEFERVVKALKREFKETYKESFFIDEAKKMPHKIPRKYEIDEAETIAIIDRDYNKFSTISSESHIISSLNEKINKRRIYANEDVVNKARDLISQTQQGHKNRRSRWPPTGLFCNV